MMFGWGKKEDNRHEQESPEAEKQSHGIPTVRFDPTKVTATVKADLRQNIKSLAEVGPSDFEAIYDAALRSISAGRALNILYQALLTIDSIGKGRAEEISSSLNNKATALIQSEQQERLGIAYAFWLYSGAPCGNTEQDAAHKAANRKPYRVNKGMFLNGRWTWPGREDGCKCISKSIIVGLDSYKGGIPEGFKE
jgi:hypothetical protein